MPDGGNHFAEAAHDYHAERQRQRDQDHVDSWLYGVPFQSRRNVAGADRAAAPTARAAERTAAFRAALQPLADIKPAIKARHLVKDWLEIGTLSVTYGESNGGKTFFALDMSLHIAAGAGDWHGARVAEGGGPVVYIAAEGGHGIRNRLAAFRQENPELAKRAGKEFLLLPGTVDFCGNGDAEALIEALKDLETPPRLIVLDTLARSMGDGDENTAKDMGAFIRNLDLIRAATGAHVMVIHHSGKDTSKGARGSNSLRAAVDTEIELTRSGDVVMAETKKQRDMPTDKVFAYTLKSVPLGRDEDGDLVTSAVVQPSDPVKKAPRLSGQQSIAMQALDDAVANHGERKTGEMFPRSRRCVPLATWREYCDRHSLSSGDGESSRRAAFHKVKTALQNKGEVRILDGFVWCCRGDDDHRSQRCQALPATDGNAGSEALPPLPGSMTRQRGNGAPAKEQEPDHAQASGEEAAPPDQIEAWKAAADDLNNPEAFE
ncbi:helicase RepA family protein [Mangrovicoccus sp. HB161399]|uniref:helicase RepA family protein n=1 Tax=Mangrovicoccus sp. HB161399 TaxID=2720392 RepID=UPI001555A580|nr:helicase RepA family protein [Mangrovicoccus sp. HB161399]